MGDLEPDVGQETGEDDARAKPERNQGGDDGGRSPSGDLAGEPRGMTEPMEVETQAELMRPNNTDGSGG